MKRIVISLMLILLCFCGSAQKKQMEQRLKLENIQLKIKIDSLQTIIDSLSQEVEMDEAIVQEFTPAGPEKMTPEETDSLTKLWYESIKFNDYETYDINLDSIRLTSDVSDSVLIGRLKAINPIITLPFNETVKNYMILYTEKMKKTMGHVMGLSTYYMPIIETALDRYDLPFELKYLAIIESLLNPTAVSRAGAKGMWQFMYTTARSYGLKINSFVDERYDAEKAVDAAARYLRDAYKVYGDWCLAISSYNCGPGNVNKAIRRAGSREFWQIYPYLPRETRGYMPGFVGAMYAFNYYKEYGIVPEDVGMPAAVDTLLINKNLHFKQINEVVGVPLEIIKQYNPQYTHDIIPGNEGTCVLKLPFEWVPAFMDADQDTLYNHKSTELMSEQILKNIKASGSESRVAYRVKSGDYLGRIASRYHVTVNQIMKWNHLRSSNLRVGQILYIYGKGYEPATTSNSNSTATKASASSGSTSNAGNTNNYTIYVVKNGDTLYSIAKNYPGVSAQNIMDFNHIGSSIRPGTVIRIPKK